MGRHGGGAFSGKDPSKVDRSAAYMCRWVAKNVVAAGLADPAARLQVAYAIGHPASGHRSVSIPLEPDELDEEAIEHGDSTKSSRSSPPTSLRSSNLLRPIYRKTTNYGHFGREDDLEALTVGGN